MKCISGILLLTAAACAADFTNGQAARAVIGQTTFTAADPNSSDTVIGAAGGIAYAANTLFVADDNRVGAAPSNNRVLLFQNLSSMLPAPSAELADNTNCPACVGQATVVLGQSDFNTTTTNVFATQNNLREPTAIASDGIHLVVADTNHNRVLIWNSIPNVNDAPADVVVGQPNFTSYSPSSSTPSATTMRGPQGVWIVNGKLYVADTQNNRVLIYNRIPSQNGVAADVVLGAPNFTTFVTQDPTQSNSANAGTMANPVSVTSDGVHLFVSDLGNNRVLIWSSIPAINGTPADVVIGQPDMTSTIANNAFTGAAATSSSDTTNREAPVLCTGPTGVDPMNNSTYPALCNATLSFPRFALSDGTRLFIADGGNDRVLEFRTIPTGNGASADIVLGQLGGTFDQATDAVDSMTTPTSMAWDGSNLYVADPYNRRITVYSVAANDLPYQAVVNSASLNIVASGSVTIGGTIQTGDTVTVSITNPGHNAVNYTYKVQAADTVADLIAGLVNAINNSNGGAGDPSVLATGNNAANQVVLTSKLRSEAGNTIAYTTSVSSGAQTTATTAGANLTGGGAAAKVAPGTLVSINGSNLSAGIASADLHQPQLPTQLGSTEVYFNGIKAPLLYVSPTQVNAQIPWELNNTTSVNAFVRSVMRDGSISVTSPVAVTIVPANPGIFTYNGAETPEIAVAVHGSSNAIGIVSVDGTANPGDVATVTVLDRTYNYTVQSGDTLDTIRDNLVPLINNDLAVTARAAGVFDRIILMARVEGPEGNNITYGANAASGNQVVMTAFASTLCCANVKGSPITQANPAVPGEVITVYATGLGLPALNDTNSTLISTGVQYPLGAPQTVPTTDQFVSSIVGGSTADVLDATLMPGTVGIFQVDLHLNSNLATNPYAAMTIAQSTYVSNSVTIPVQSGGLPSNSSGGTTGSTSNPGTPGQATPSANITAVVNAASFQTGFTSATWLSIFGTNLSQTTQGWQKSDFVGNFLPTSLSGVSVTINGLAAYIAYVSPTQINVLAPDDMTVGPVQVLVTTALGSSNTFTAQKQLFVPSLFSMSGTGYVAALHTDYTLIGKPGLIAGLTTTPARPGETIVIYGTGFGPTNPALPTSQLVTTPAILANPVRVMIGGMDASVTYAGLVGPGLYQINATVPNLPDGDATVVAQIEGIQTQPQVSITIQQ